MEKTVKNLEGQVEKFLQDLNQRSLGSLPSGTFSNPKDKGKENVMAMDLQHLNPHPEGGDMES